jgi:hypothetical protein
MRDIQKYKSEIPMDYFSLGFGAWILELHVLFSNACK